MAWEPKVNRHVTLLKFEDDTVKLKPGVITDFATDDNPIIRVGRHDTSGDEGVQYETYGDTDVGVPRRVDPSEPITETVYISY